jgi:hypothetical protein
MPYKGVTQRRCYEKLLLAQKKLTFIQTDRMLIWSKQSTLLLLLLKNTSNSIHFPKKNVYIENNSVVHLILITGT